MGTEDYSGKWSPDYTTEDYSGDWSPDYTTWDYFGDWSPDYTTESYSGDWSPDYPWDYSNDWYTTGSPDWPSTSDGENNWGPTTVSPETSEGWWPSFTTGIPSRPTVRSALIN